MALVFAAWIVITILEAAIVMGGFQPALELERRIPLVSHELELSRLRERDRLRHGRLLQSSSGGVVDFPVQGNYDPFLVRLYYTKLLLGSPPKEYYVQIDTGSDAYGLVAIPATVAQNLVDFDSSTSSLISCSDQQCNVGLQSSDSGCSDNQCSYTFQYGDGNAACQTGDLTKSDRAVDGIFGLGQQSLPFFAFLIIDAFGFDLFFADLVLRDKIFVYDLANQQIGWTDSDCSTSVNVSASLNSGRPEFVNAGQMSNGGSSSRDQLRSMIALLIPIIVLNGLLFSWHILQGFWN
ncbi:Eukaryotic aspartyl protease family protein isoform 2 [Hibiscus syriacus]|uniref:Eukaryotic aspartyl protease family protein isoform 2 n=1 Tax=Hibiscus syriacus TaxID=106335 RepID=A0A6A2ZHG7_HIBSY|nr:Eukaryotic aspartyl protease family protein isoform 2 [Hibiscus syriacus]